VEFPDANTSRNRQSSTRHGTDSRQHVTEQKGINTSRNRKASTRHGTETHQRKVTNGKRVQHDEAPISLFIIFAAKNTHQSRGLEYERKIHFSEAGSVRRKRRRLHKNRLHFQTFSLVSSVQPAGAANTGLVSFSKIILVMWGKREVNTEF
jgi:hypothetical protein